MNGKNILITGGTGLVGQHIVNLLKSKDYTVGILTRKNVNKKNYFRWDYTKNYIDPKALEFADVIIHLSGENIAKKRWSKAQKQLIIDSRTKTTELIEKNLAQQNKKLDLFVSASAIGFYGTFTDNITLTENHQQGNDFLADVVGKWENSVDKIKNFAERIVKFRIGVVMSDKGGALPEIYRTVKLGFGSPLGNGKQQMPWIAAEDLARLFVFAIENKNLTGTYNAVNENITNKELTKDFAKKLQKPYFLPKVPAFVIRLLFGEMSCILLKGSKISSEKIRNSGFNFEYNLADVFEKFQRKH